MAIETIEAGERLSLTSGIATVTALRTETLAEPVKVYNFQVADWHTYYAAPEADKPFVWVHNANYAEGIANRGGRFGDLDANRQAGEVGHHMPQNAFNRQIGRSRADGPAVGMTIDDHALTRTFAGKGRKTMREDAGLTARQRLAQDIRDVRSLFGKKYNRGSREAIQYAKTLPEYAR